MKNQLKIAVMLVLSVLLVGCDNTPPSQQLIEFSVKLYNWMFAFGWLAFLVGMVKMYWRPQTGFMIICASVIFLMAAYIVFAFYCVIIFDPRFTIKLVIPFFN